MTKYVVILEDSTERTLVVGPFDDQSTAEIFANNVSPLPEENLNWRIDVLFDPVEYMSA